ncbi:NADH dehydrogenase [Amycolatopsis mediterranei S699]|uniref:NADH dehydrogenase n=2 Tax=Amycolatopsis mediterranei TaxID=33910 RepID=A0A0H3D8L3_AMYMU|nr:NAD(P)/FAD-dependent oxidoreductase [Amycolatopsis mediterranei]ADJ46986.1 NADH dehydrogenase [Amycolatopsis mediterranei U32]AEK43798.1 NADH dehydrogenase [Amycolatopsis mediterranei S699]AFO78697.1 NADH dehydrogenase [Amycolatopsis mediterranei S699]AGT85825.1 NADH dehydrogenase [Amycolatopsis mediterranei RB]KDO04578.1 NADH dehydrogenase [Amycolatopsis mediterranei]
MRVVIVGGGFAGYHAAKSLRKEAGDDVEVVVLNPTDYFLYLPLLPEVAAGILDPRRVAVSIPETLPGVRLVLGVATGVDFDSRHVTYTDPEDNEHRIGYDRLVLAAGSVNKLLPIPGVPEYAHGFRGVPEALYLRDHITRQIELAAAAEDPAERDARCTFVVVGAGYTGTEVAAQGPAFTAALAARHPELAGQRIRWLLVDVAERVLPELAGRLGRTADQVLRSRGVEVLMKTSVDHADAKGVTLTNGDAVPARTLVWCVGVRPDPLVAGLGLETAKGRLVVTEQLNVPGRDDVFACGDAAAVPDLTRPGQYTAMTAQHAERQGRLAGRNVAASLGYGRRGTYRHHDLGFVVDLGAGAAAANPLHIPLSGRPAKAVTRGYHLMAMPGNRLRTAVDWLLEALTGRQTVQLGLVRSGAVPLDTDSPELPRR